MAEIQITNTQPYSAELIWALFPNETANSIANYTLEVAQDADNKFQPAICIGSLSTDECVVEGNSTTVSSLQPYTDYRIAVRASSKDGYGPRKIVHLMTDETG